MAEQQLNRADVGPAFEQMYGKRMSKQMGRNEFGNPGTAASFLTRLFDGVLADVRSRTIPREQPRARTFRAPPVAQDVEQFRREHHVPIFLALPLLDPDHHPAAI